MGDSQRTYYRRRELGSGDSGADRFNSAPASPPPGGGGAGAALSGGGGHHGNFVSEEDIELGRPSTPYHIVEILVNSSGRAILPGINVS